MATRGTRMVCIREVQKTLKESSKRLLEDKLSVLGLSSGQGFKIFNEVIQTHDGELRFNFKDTGEFVVVLSIPLTSSTR